MERQTISLREEAELQLAGCRRRYELAQAALQDFRCQHGNPDVGGMLTPLAEVRDALMRQFEILKIEENEAQLQLRKAMADLEDVKK